MYISSINNYKFNKNPYLNKQDNKPQNICFNGKLNPTSFGYLSPKVSKNFNVFLHDFDDIMMKLSCKTEEGIRYIMEHFPVTITDGIILHKCGENKDSIAINAGGGDGIQKLTHIVRRNDMSVWSEKKVKEAFMLESSSKVLSEFKTNYMNTFPKERIYMTQEEIEQSETDARLEKLFVDLQENMLKFQIFLLQHNNEFQKAPDGKLPYNIIEEINKTERILNDAVDNIKKIPPKQLFKLLNETFKEYIPRKGNSTYSFKDLGEEKVTISFAKVNSQYHENLKRLTVFNKDGSCKKVFLLQNNKLVKNTGTGENGYTYLADKLEFYDENEIQKGTVADELLKYLKLYQRAASKLQAIVAQRAKIIEERTIEGFFPDDVTNNLNNATKTFEELISLYTSASTINKRMIKEQLIKLGIKLTPSGITFPSGELFKDIYFQPVKTNLHSNLLKFFITDHGTETLDCYLIHNNKQIVKNYWANSPNIIPQKIRYLEENEMPDLTKISKNTLDKLTEIKNTVANILKNESELRMQAKIEAQKKAELRRLNKIQTKIEAQKEAELRRRNKIQTPKKHTPRVTSKKSNYSSFAKECKKQFTDAIKNLDKGIEEFNKAIQEIQNKVAKFYEEHK